VAPSGEPGHQPVSRAWPQAGTDVEARRHRVQDDRDDEEPEPQRHRARLGQKHERAVERETDQEHVAHRAETGALAEGDPKQQHDEADDDRDRADAHAGALGDPLVEDIPRVESQPRLHEERDAHPEEHQACVQVDQTADRC